MEQVTGPNEALATCLELLRQTRNEVARQAQAVTGWEEEIAKSGPGQALQGAKDRLGELKNQQQEIEDNVRQLALDAYQRTQEKQVAPGIGIRVYRKVCYNEMEMVDWCKENAPIFVRESVDGKAISKMADDLAQKGAPLRIDETPSATIATDLDKVLPAPEPLPDGEHGPEMGRL